MSSHYRNYCMLLHLFIYLVIIIIIIIILFWMLIFLFINTNGLKVNRDIKNISAFYFGKKTSPLCVMRSLPLVRTIRKPVPCCDIWGNQFWAKFTCKSGTKTNKTLIRFSGVSMEVRVVSFRNFCHNKRITFVFVWWSTCTHDLWLSQTQRWPCEERITRLSKALVLN